MLFIVDDRFIFHLLTLLVSASMCFNYSDYMLLLQELRFCNKSYFTVCRKIWQGFQPSNSRIKNVVLDGYKLVKEVYLRHDDSLAGRPVLPLFYDIVGDKGQCNV